MSGHRPADGSVGPDGRSGRSGPDAPHGSRAGDGPARSGARGGPGEPHRPAGSDRPRDAADRPPPDPVGTLFFMILFVLLLVGLWGTVFWMLLER